MRSRPRLKLVLIRCDFCGRQKLRYYPARERVRSKLSPFTFCSTKHARKHWEERRRQAAAAEARPYLCAGPGCPAPIDPTLRPGRPREYCSDRCKAAAAAERARREPGGAVVRTQARARTQHERAAAARREADTFRENINRHVEVLEQARQNVAKQPSKLVLTEHAVKVAEDIPRWRQKLVALDAAAAAAERAAQQAEADIQRAQDKLAKRAADARRRRARGRELEGAGADVEREAHAQGS